MPLPPVVALEVGTSKVVAVVGEMREDGRLLITGMGEHVSKGVRKGEIVDLDNAVVCVRGALHAAEESGQVTIRRVHVAMSGGHIQSHVTRGSSCVLRPDGEITDVDIEEVIEMAKAVNLPSDREMLHTICQHFCVDDQQYVTNPRGLTGAKLTLNMLAVHGVRSRLHNTVKVVHSVPMEVQDVAFSGLCAGLAVLTPEQKEIGAVVIDLGGGTTSYVAHADKVLAAAGVIGVGGDHITNDISLAFNISLRHADLLKLEDGSAVVDPAHRARRVKVPEEVGFPEQSVGLGALHIVINARIRETLEIIKARLDSCEISSRFGAGVILTGGGARLGGVADVAAQVFGLPCRIGRASDVDGLAAAIEGPEYAAAIGMVRYGFSHTAAAEEDVSITRWIKGLFGRK